MTSARTGAMNVSVIRIRRPYKTELPAISVACGPEPSRAASPARYPRGEPMSTKDIRTSAADLHASCDVCGRTLLRGERPHSFLEGTELRSVCELCTQRAAQ